MIAREHLIFTPRDGLFVGITQRGRVSIRVLGLNREQLATTRRDAWGGVQLLVHHYDQMIRAGNDRAAKDAKEKLRAFPFALVLDALVAFAALRDEAAPIYPGVVEAIAARPELFAP